MHPKYSPPPKYRTSTLRPHTFPLLTRGQKVALAAAKGQKTIAELSQEYKVHPTQIVQWKRQFMDSLPEIFSVRRKKEQQEQELLTNELYQQIGQLKVELDWLKKKSGYDT